MPVTRHQPQRPACASLACALLALGAGSSLNGCVVDFGPRGEDVPPCGNSALDPGEGCDDGNLRAGDGCDDACQVEPGWTCAPGAPSACDPRCGDGRALGDEVCDGWDVGGVTCESLGFEGGTLTCETDCSDLRLDHCEGYCGDGLVGGQEACDGENLDGQDCTAFGFYAGALTCDQSCTLDLTGCRESCGDGVLNGPEACDGALLNGRNCLTLGHYGGTLACQPDCLAFDESGCHRVPRILVNELQSWIVSYLELVNRSEVAVDLAGFVLRIEQEATDGTVTPLALDLPAYSLPPEGRVVLRDTFMGGGGPPSVDGETIQFDVRFGLWRRPGAISLLTPLGEPTDFLRWGGSTVPPPPGTGWSEVPSALPTFFSSGQDLALSRLPDGTDGDIAGDFCVTAATEGTPNTAMCEALTPPGTVLVTEVDTGTVNGIELYNASAAAVDLQDWALEAYDGADNYWSVILPAFTLGPGAYVKVVGDLVSGSPTVQAGILHVTDLGWAPGQGGACWISEPLIFQPVDWVQWGGLDIPPVNRYDWEDTPQPLDPPDVGETLGRRTLADSDRADDWCLQPGTLGGPNGACQ